MRLLSDKVKNEYDIKIERNIDWKKTFRDDFCSFMKIRIRDTDIIQPYLTVDFDHKPYRTIIQQRKDLKSYQKEFITSKRPYFLIVKPANVVVNLAYIVLGSKKFGSGAHTIDHLDVLGATKFIANFNEIYR